MSFLEKVFRIDARALKKIERKAKPVFALEEKYRKMTDRQLKDMTPELKRRLAEGATVDDILPDAFATAREAARRTIGQYPYPVQVFGSTVLNEGDVAEMKTGEGKTLTATMAVYLNALEGKGVHVVTVNQYLASRDADWMGQIYRFLGLTVGVNSHDKNTADKQAAYNCDITYTTNSELGFDYLRDNMATSVANRVLRHTGLHFAIIDEADSILVDESRTPLIISGGSGVTVSSYTAADRAVKSLHENVDFTIDVKKKVATLTDAGINKLQADFGIANLFEPRYGPQGPRVLRWPPAGHPGQGARRDQARDRDHGHHHLPELLPPLRQAGRHDRYRQDRGGGVPQDLQHARHPHPHQPPRHPLR